MVAQSCPTLCNPMDHTFHGILQARILEWVAFPFSRGSSQPRNQTQVSRIPGKFFTSWATGKPKNTRVGSLSLLQQIFLAQESNQGLLHFRQILYQLSYEGRPKGRGIRDQIANIRWMIKKAREFQKNIYFWVIDHAKAVDSVDHNNLWKILIEVGIPDHLTCLLRILYAGQEATVRTGHGTTDWFQIGKGVCQGCISSPCLFNLHADYIMWNARLDKAQARIKTAGKYQ